MDDRRRALLFTAIAGAAAVPFPGSGPSAAAENKASEPRQGWAHKDGAVAMRAPSKVAALANPMDYLLIHEAFARYGMAHDELRFDILSELFTDEAVLEVAKGNGKPFQTVKSGKAIVANFANVLSQQQDQRRHCFSNILIEELTADRALAIAYGLVSVAADGLILGATVIYRVELRKAGHWRFSRLFIGMDDYTTSAPKV
ncbi:nuclear transport factor 2 family protein [Sphingobium sp.]|uniref:nuclear transport factor 2 family protein n=1 Tax=Sphingobium sp. TaxID=1912891 RepID=UPI0028BE90B3|nr:nuclear transport factor 2 family protein [Sphingobium sp.]